MIYTILKLVTVIGLTQTQFQDGHVPANQRSFQEQNGNSQAQSQHHQQQPHQQQQQQIHQQQEPVQGQIQEKRGRVLHKNIDHERKHVEEHMKVPVDTSQMSEQELQFHYFKMHDTVANNKLDGCELVKSVIHWHEESHGQKPGARRSPPPKIFLDSELSSMIDPILVSDDKNKDGFIDYYEFLAAQQNAQIKSAT